MIAGNLVWRGVIRVIGYLFTVLSVGCVWRSIRYVFAVLLPVRE